MHENLVRGYWVALGMIVGCLVFVSCVFTIMFAIRLLRKLRRPKKPCAKEQGGKVTPGETKQQIVAPVMVMMAPQNVQDTNTAIGVNLWVCPTGVSSEPVGVSYTELSTDPAAVAPHQTGVQPPGLAYDRLATDPVTPYPTGPYPVGILREPIGIAHARLATDPNEVNPYPTEVSHVTFASDPTEVAANPTGIAHARLATDPTGADENCATVVFNPNTTRVTGFVVL